MPSKTRTAKTAPSRIAIYLRQSLDAKDDRAAVQRQLSACQRWVKLHRPEAKVVAIFEDNDTSASKRGVVRKEWQRMLSEAQAGEFDLIVAYHLDRLTRTIRDLLPLLDLATHHGVGTTTVSGEIDLSSDMGRLVAGILAVVAQAEVDRKGARQVLANEQRRAAGKPTQGGRRAFGYEVDGMTVVASEAKLIRRACDAFLSGTPLSAIAREWNAAGVRTVLGRPFGHHAVALILSNPRNAAIVATGPDRDELGPAAWPAIVTQDTYRAVRAKLADPQRRTNQNRGGERRRLLTGVALCGICADESTTVVGGSRGRGLPVYMCSGAVKGHLQRIAEPLDEVVEEHALALLGSPLAAELLIDGDAPDVDVLSRERLALVAQQDSAAALFAERGINAKQLKVITAKLTARIDKIDAQLSHSTRERVLGDLVRAADPAPVWASMSIARRQAVLRALGTYTIERGIVGGTREARRRDPRVTFTDLAGQRHAL
jgi:DNA invertase Pin-like site-specific DNA recombinase